MDLCHDTYTFASGKKLSMFPAQLSRCAPSQASDIVKKGKMCSLFINDLDAGAGRMGEGTQYTVNNQMVGLPG